MSAINTAINDSYLYPLPKPAQLVHLSDVSLDMWSKVGIAGRDTLGSKRVAHLWIRALHGLYGLYFLIKQNSKL